MTNELDLNQSNSESRKLRTAKGFSMIGIGAIILLGGCIISMVMSSTNPFYNYFLYIPTSIGASMVIYGMYCVLE
ncbi:MAG: hypothetical protein ACOVO9_10980 [Bacteroidia bacterium]